MAGEDEVDSPPLLSKCLDFCQALARQGHTFNISIAFGTSFSFSLDTRSKEVVTSQVTKNKASPSTRRRNAKRRAEFLARKQQNSSPRTSSDPAATELKCDQCEYEAASVKGLKQHTRMKHKEVEIERMRKPSDRPPLSVSPIKDQSREEPCHNCGGEGSPGHQCEENLADQVCRPDRICDCSNPDCCTCVHDDSCQCFEDCEATAYCDCTIPYCVQLQT